MKTIELFSGTKSFSKVAKEWEYDTITIDNNKNLNPDFCLDILKIINFETFKDFDILWASPPCPSHSKVRYANQIQNKPIYPDMTLYQEILFLKGYFKGKFVVENVISWYEPLIKPIIYKKHFYWSNFVFDNKDGGNRGMGKNESFENLSELKGFDLSKYSGIDKIKTLRNCVEPQAGLYIFNSAFKEQQQRLF